MKIIKYLFLFITFFTFLNCNPCENTICFNDGICSRGNCECPEQWTGEDCSEEKTPTRVEIKNLSIIKYPQYKLAGGKWDTFDNPDLYIKIYWITKNKDYLVFQSEPIENVVGNPNFELNFSFDIINDTSYELRVYDEDYQVGIQDDYIGFVEFKPYVKGKSFPVSISSEKVNQYIDYTIDRVSYFFE